MSINNIENIAFNYLTNLTTINADEVNTDILTKVDPNISDLQFDMLEGIRTDETIQQQIDAIENQIGNIGASYWLSAWDTTTQTNPVANTPRPMTWNSSDPASNGIVAGPISGSIKVLNSNTYNIQFSIEIKSGSSSTSEITIWLRKNGTDVSASASEYDIKGNDFYTIGWNFVLPLVANDYVQVMWASSDTSMTLAYQAAQTSPYSHPAIPSVIITVTNVTGEGPAGPQGLIGPQGPQGERGPRGYKGEPGDGSVDETARALAGTALALATTAQATAILAESTAVGAVTANAAQDVAIGVLQVKTQKIQYKSATDSTEISNNITMPNFENPFTEPSAIVLKNDSQSVFRYGITSSDLISTTNRFISTSGQSYFNSVTVNTDLDIGTSLAVGTTCTIGDSVFIGRADNSQKKIVLYDGNSGNDYDYTGIFVSNSTGANNFNCEIDGNPDSSFGWYAGDGFGLTRTLLKTISSTTEISYTDEAIFLEKNGFSQNIRMVRDIPNNNVQLTMMGDSAGLGDYDGRIIQQAGNGLTDGTGIMSFESGTINIVSSLNNTLISSAAQVNINADDEININATSILGKIKLSTDTNDIELISAGGIVATANEIISATTANAINLTNTRTSGNAMTFTSNTSNTTDTDLTLTNSNILSNVYKVKATGGLKIDSVGQCDLLVNDALTIATTSIGFDFNLIAGQDMKLTSENNTFIKSTYGKLDLTTLSNTNGLIELNSAYELYLKANQLIDIVSSTSNVNITSTTSDVIVTASDIEMNATTGGVVIVGDTGISLSAITGNINLTSVADDINLSASDIEIATISGGVNIIGEFNTAISATTGTININSVAGDLNTDAYGVNSMEGGSVQILSASTTELTGTSNTTIRSTSGNIDLISNTGDINLNSTDMTATITGNIGLQGAGMNLTATTTNLALSAVQNISLTSTTQNILLTTSGTGDISVTSSDLLNLTATNGIQLKNQIYFNRTPNAGEYTSNNQAIGFTNSINTGTAYSGTASDTSSYANVGSFTLPSRGAWFIQVSVKITLNTGSDTITNRSILVSEVSGSGVGGDVEIAPCFIYADPIDDGAGSAGERQNISLVGVFHWTATATKTLYINAIVQTNGSRTVTVNGNIKYTRIA